MTKDEKAPLTADDKFEFLMSALTEALTKNQGGMSMDAIREMMRENSAAISGAMQKAANPSNPHSSGKSAFDYPEGGLVKPKPQLPYEMWYAGFPMHLFPETEHWRELELCLLIKPGEYTIIRKDGGLMKVAVRGERDASEKLTKVSIEFSCSREEKWLIPPKIVLLYQLAYQEVPARQRFIQAMQEHLQLTMGGDVLPSLQPVSA
jgi:hypothetical protein